MPVYIKKVKAGDRISYRLAPTSYVSKEADEDGIIVDLEGGDKIYIKYSDIHKLYEEDCEVVELT